MLDAAGRQQTINFARTLPTIAGQHNVFVRIVLLLDCMRKIRGCVPETLPDAISNVGCGATVPSDQCVVRIVIVIKLIYPMKRNLSGSSENAASEDRTHDLRIMGPTRHQLRYRRCAIDE